MTTLYQYFCPRPCHYVVSFPAQQARNETKRYLGQSSHAASHVNSIGLQWIARYTVEPLLTATSDERPPCLLRTLTLVPIASLFKIVLKKPLLRGHLSTPYNGQLLRPQMMPINTKSPLVTASFTHFLTAKKWYLTGSAKNDHYTHILFTVRTKIASELPNCRFSKNYAAI